MVFLGQRLNRRVISVGVILAAVVTFFGVNIVAGERLGGWRLDLTADQRFTVSEGTREVLAGIDEPITLRFYRSNNLGDLGPNLEAHAGRVGDFLAEYVTLADGMLRVERYDPRPFSPEEDQAVADGLQGLPIGLTGEQVYLGLSGFNMTDDRQTLGYLAPERIDFIEYDLTRLIHDLANPEKPVLQVVGDLPLYGLPINQYQRWAVTDTLEEVFDVRRSFGELDRIDDDVDVVLLGQPTDLTPQIAYAVDQFALRGGRLLVVLDPMFENGAMPPQQPPAGFAGVDDLLAAWGIAIAPETVLGDRQTGVRVQVQSQGRPVVTTYPIWFTADPSQFDLDDPSLAQLQRLAFNSPGAIELTAEATTTLTPLVVTTTDVAAFARDELLMPDPLALLDGYEPEGAPRTIVARVEGDVATAFPDGPPEGVDQVAAGEHLSDGTAPLSLIVVADADFFADAAWIQRQQLLGQEFAVPIANNGDFVVNAAESLAGGEGLTALRGRGFDARPFTVIDAMEREAEQRFRATEQELVARLEETQAKIDEIRLDEAEQGIVLTAAQEEAVAGFRDELLAIRGELRDVRFALDEDVELLATRLRLLNIVAVPALVAFFAIGLLVWRRRQGERSAVRGLG